MVDSVSKLSRIISIIKLRYFINDEVVQLFMFKGVIIAKCNKNG